MALLAVAVAAALGLGGGAYWWIAQPSPVVASDTPPQRDEQPVASGHLIGAAISLHIGEMLAAEHRAVDLQAVLTHRLVLAAQQKMHIVPGQRQLHAVIATDSAGTNDRNA